MPFYSLADIAVDSAADLSIDEMGTKVVAALEGRTDVLEKGPEA